MRIVIFGASGNIGTALRGALRERSPDADIVAIARRLPSTEPEVEEKTSWIAADLRASQLERVIDGADVVVNLAWLFHPSHRPEQTWRNNVIGASRLLEAVKRQGTPAVVWSSSVAAYSPRDGTDPIDESWPTHGTSPAAYCREKAYVERLLDQTEHESADRRVVRIRPGFVFHHRAAIQQRRLFAGPFVPTVLLRPGRLPIVPIPDGMLLQAVHASDVGGAFAQAALSNAQGAFNICADTALNPIDIARVLGSRRAPVPRRLAKAALRAAWTAHAVPADPLLFDALMEIPIMDNKRAKAELGWTPRYTAAEAFRDFLTGLQGGQGHATPPLAPATSGPMRVNEFATGVGERE